MSGEEFRRLGGWPGSEVEAWKYTSLDQWLGPLDRVVQESSRKVNLNFSNRSWPSQGLTINDITLQDEAGIDAYTAAAQALHRGGVSIQVPAGYQGHEPVVLSLVGDMAPGLHGINDRIHVGAGARLRILQVIHPTFEGSLETKSKPLALAALLNLRLSMDEGAEVEIIRWIRSKEATGILCQTQIEQAQGSKVHVYTLAQGSGLIRHQILAHQHGDDAYTGLYGLTFATQGGHADQYSRIRHHALRGQSHQHYKAVAAPASSTVFNGVLRVELDAQETNAFQKSSNLMLDIPGSGLPSGKVHAKPELQILADNVRCSHGATMGKLQEDAVFYLRSRGVQDDEARRILTLAFAMEIVDMVPDESFRLQMQAELEAMPTL
ncbi:MAG: SufD family Fe-S cluster assembly protein [Bacteroidia bacterium]